MNAGASQKAAENATPTVTPSISHVEEEKVNTTSDTNTIDHNSTHEASSPEKL